MTLSQAIRHRIYELCSERGITLNKLSIICGITQSTLHNVVSRPETKPTVSTIKKICDGLDMKLIDFFDSDLFLDLEQEIQ